MSNHAEYWRWAELGGQAQAPAALPSGKWSSAHCTVGVQAPLPGWTVQVKGKFLAPWGLESRTALFVVSPCSRSYTYQKINMC